MIAALDNTFLSLFLNPNAKPKPDPNTGQPVPHCKERVEDLIDKYAGAQDVIIIPTPCLAELLTAVPDISKSLEIIEQSSSMQIASFDARCATELAIETRKAIDSGDKRSGVSADWQKVKFDRQIAIIAKVKRAEVFYTDDNTQAEFARQLGIEVQHTWDLSCRNQNLI